VLARQGKVEGISKYETLRRIAEVVLIHMLAPNLSMGYMSLKSVYAHQFLFDRTPIRLVTTAKSA